MKVKAICAAVAAALGAGIVDQASALTLEKWVNDPANFGAVFMGGSTALDTPLQNYMQYVCSAPLDEFIVQVDQTPTFSIPGQNIYAQNPVKQTVFFCALNAAHLADATLAGKKLFLTKSQGDSGEGVAVAPGTVSINFVQTPAVTNTNVQNGVSNYSCTAGATIAAVPPNLVSIQQWNCTAVTSTQSAPNVVGLADVEMSLLNSIPLVPTASQASLDALTTNNIAANVWGFAVTKVFRDALQTVQGFTPGSENEDQMPTLSRGTITSVLTGTISTLDQLTDSAGHRLFSDAAAAGVTKASSGNLYIVRRPDSSGTNTSIRVMLTSEFCTANAASLVTDSGLASCGATLPFGSGPVVRTEQSTGGLLGCLGTLNNNKFWGIGFAGTGNRPLPGTDAGWRWIKVDGASPSLINAATGRYNLFTEAVMAYQGAGPGTATNVTGKFVKEMGGQLANPIVISGINGGNATQSYATPVWQGGVAIPSVNAGGFNPPSPITAATLQTTPVLPFSRSALGANSCQPPQLTNGSINVTVQANQTGAK